MRRKFKISFDAKASVGGKFNIGVEGTKMNLYDVGTEYERKVLEFEAVLNGPFDIYNMSGVSQHLYIKDFMIDIVDELDGIPTDYEPYQGETIKVTNDTESPAFGLKSHKGITNIISPGNVKCVYPTNESGKGVLDSLYNKDKMLTEQNESLEVLGKCKNLLSPTLQTTTQNGVTCTNNGDGTYTLNGTATNLCIFWIQSNVFIKKGTYKFVGTPPNISNVSIGGSICAYVPYEGVVITIDDNTIGSVAITIQNGVKCVNTVFKPMITTDLNATYDDFVPYTGDGKTLTHDVAELKNDLVASNAGAHNCVYRGKYLGNALTTEQKAQISAGTFNDLYIGDYWTIDGVNYRIAAFDYWLNSGDTSCTKHHVVIVPDSCLYNAKMNTTNVTTGAYIGSEM